MSGSGEHSLLAADEGHEIASATEVDDAEDPERDEELDVDLELTDPDREEETRTGSVASASSVGQGFSAERRDEGIG